MNELKKYLEKNGPTQNTVVEKKSNNLLVIILTFLLTTLIVGSGVFFYQKTSFEDNKNEALENLETSFQEQIASLTEQIEELTKEEEEVEENSNEESLGGYLTYTNPDADFSFQYPEGIKLIAGGSDNVQELSMSVTVQNIDNMLVDAPDNLSQSGSQSDMLALNQGLFNPNGLTITPWSLDASEQVISIDGKNSKSFVTFGRFEVCSALLERSLVFYNNGHRVTITLYGPKDSIIASMPYHWHSVPGECGSASIWKEGQQVPFYQLLLAGNASTIAQNWFNTFDNIIDSIDIEYGNIASVLENIFTYNHNVSSSNITVSIIQQTSNYTRGEVTINGETSIFLAAKGNGDWNIIHEGNGALMCDAVASFPEEMKHDCAG